jgi:hypothetical protein
MKEINPLSATDEVNREIHEPREHGRAVAAAPPFNNGLRGNAALPENVFLHEFHELTWIQIR